MNTAFCGLAHDTLLSNRNTEKLNFDTNCITKKIDNLIYANIRLFVQQREY